ncbi:hypothetical protein COV93_08770 [Candidatus Woesearchaeota archaeon CG11_big_fil_rev_8_21_14_0_20_43_8]|nr:MAG: hypothetical protein COV93_08770 [Candidatus Woesearchaeota archaeon CG11_big_fil_rev_8_21_14_0_20_43_8]
MAEGDYELIPHKEILDLKTQIEELRKQKGLVERGAEAEIEITNKELYDSMNKLIEGINQLIKLFKRAGEEFSHYDESDSYVKKLTPMEKKIDEALEQNKKIARGILAVSDSLKEQIQKLGDDFDEKLDKLKDNMRGPSHNMNPYDQGFGGQGNMQFGGGGVPPPPIPPPQPPK